MRLALALLAAAVVAWLGGKILAEYPFDSLLPILGGGLLGLAVTGTLALVLRAEPPAWAILVGAALGVAGEWIAVIVQKGPKGSIPWQAYAALVAAAIGGAWRLRSE